MTGAKAQNISPVSDLIHRAFKLLPRSSRSVRHLKADQLTQLIMDLEESSPANLEQANQLLVGNPVLAGSFQNIFGFSPGLLTTNLPLPPTVRCAGNAMLWNSTNQSVVFPLTENGLTGLGEFQDP